MAFKQLVELFEIAPVESHNGFRFEDALVLVQLIASGERPEETGQTLDVSALLQHFAHARHLLLREAERR